MYKQSEKHFTQAKEYFPGGVNSPVRAFKSVGGTPIFIVEGDGAEITDVDGNKYIDFCCSWGPLILGHKNHAVMQQVQSAIEKGTSFGTPTLAENRLAKLILENNPYIEKIRFVSSGTEAVMSGIRLARGYTGRSKIIKFEGCYHGHADALMVKAGSGLATLGQATSKGIPENVIADTLVLPLDDIDAVKACFEQYPEEIATVIIEPIPANNGLLKQRREFLLQLKELCHQYGALLFFDEVISGFRVHFAGASGHYDIQPDIASYGKIIGGGFPVGAYAGRKEIMDCVAPLGDVYQAGTLSGNPVAMTAGYAQLSECLKLGFYQEQEERTKYFVDSVNKFCEDKDYEFRLTTLGSIFWCKFTTKTIRKSSEIDADKMPTFSKLFHRLLKKGVYLGPSGYEVGFVSSAHTYEVLDKALDKFKSALEEIFD